MSSRFAVLMEKNVVPHKINIKKKAHKDVKLQEQKITQSDFPELIKKSVDKQQSNDVINYKDKLNTVINKNIEPKEQIKPGWVEISKDRNTKQITIKYGPKTYYPKEKTEEECAYDALKSLINTHNRRTQKYIDAWGYDEYFRMFKSPNHEINADTETDIDTEDSDSDSDYEYNDYENEHDYEYN